MVPLTKQPSFVSLPITIALVCFIFIFLGAPAVFGQSMPGFQAAEKPVVKENILLKAVRGQAPLIKLYGNLNAESSKVKRLPSLDLRESGKQTFEKLLRIGVVRQLAVPLDPISDGALYRIADGDVRVAAIVSPGSLRTRLHFQSMSLPTGARVFVYSMSDPDEFYGPYEANGPSDDGTFWTPPLTGEGVVIEYFTPAGTTSPVVPFKVSEVSHNYKALPTHTPTDAAGACNLEVPPDWSNVAKSVGMLDFITTSGEALCTGTLLNDQASDQTPYVLTAGHCINTQSEAQSVTVYWNYNTGDSPPPGTPSTVGSSLLVTGIAKDFTLLRLTGGLPAGLFFSGWDASPVSASTPVTGIHHPQGSHKRIAFGATNSDCSPNPPGPCSNFTGVTWNEGTTEPGSSGSGLWTGTPANAMLVGTLTGGEASCASLTGSDYYGRFSVIYPNISGFLNPALLTVTSSNPASGVNITVTPNDVNGLANGVTQFTRKYNRNTSVMVTAPGTAGGNNFQKWQRDGVDLTTDLVANVVLDTNHTMTAVYVPPVTFVLTVASFNPSSGVNVTVSPNDNAGLGSGTTQFTRTYTQNATVNLTAPSSAGGSTFWKWQLDGVDYIQAQLTTITMSGNHTATAIYVSPPPTPTPTPVPGAGLQPVAFVRQVSSGNNGADLFLVNADGTSAVNLTNAQGDDTKPAWSPDGTRLAYTCRTQPDGSTNGPQRICVRNADGTGFVVLSQTLAEDYGPAWSRDGNAIAFTSFYPGNQSQVYIINADGTGRRPLNLDIAGGTSPDWSADGQSIVVDYLNSIWVSRAYSYGYFRLTSNTGDSRPRFSPDGTKMVFQSTRDGQSEIYIMNSDGSGQTRLTNNPAADTAPAWSPDGTKILFTSLRDDPTNPALYIMNADGSNQKRLTDGSDGVWRPRATMRLSQSSYTVNEGDQRVNITVNRAGDTSSAASVGFATIDDAGLTNCNVIRGVASPRCDYENTVGTLTWAPGDASPKTFSIAIVDDSYAEGPETFRVAVSSPSGATLVSPNIATVTIIDNDTVDGPNPIDTTSFFVRQQYLDFLGREPDPGGGAAWVSIINGCTQGDTSCDRIHVSQNFFQSEEFQTRGYFIYRFYPVSFPNVPGSDPSGYGHKPDYAQFVPDLARVSGFLDANQLEAAKVAFIADFMARPAWVARYGSLGNTQYVDTLLSTANVMVSASTRQGWIDGLNNSTLTRAQVLRQIAESPEVYNKYYNPAFAIMEYFGYLRRDPDAAYLTWVQVLNQTNDSRGMITGFVNSNEYKHRFGP